MEAVDRCGNSHLAKEMVSFNTVEEPTFKAMLHIFDEQ